MASTLFYIKRKKLLKDGTAPIFVRITVNRVSNEFAVGKSINPQQWITVKGRVKNNTLLNKQLNSFLDQVEYQLQEIELNLQKEGKQVTAKEISKKFKGEDELNEQFISLYDEHNTLMKGLIGNSVALGTYQRHITSAKLFKEFLHAELKVNDILVRDVDMQLLEKYKYYLMTVRQNRNNTAVKYIRNLGKILHQAESTGAIKSCPIEQMKLRVNNVEKDFLTAEELDKITNHKFEILRLDQVRDIFLFCCYTGLAYSDVFTLTTEHMAKDNQNQSWIRKERNKTKNMCNIPLLKPALSILEKYQAFQFPKGRLLPVLSNQKMNSYLKEIADVSGINKNLTTHCARHTFATTVTLANQVSIENVSKMLGHSSIKMTQQYAKIMNVSIAKDMANVDLILRGDG
jgi:integrase